jgi:hypothetical protein
MEKGPLLRHDFVISTGVQRSGDLRFPLPPAPILTGAIKGLIFLVTTRARWFAMKVSPVLRQEQSSDMRPQPGLPGE